LVKIFPFKGILYNKKLIKNPDKVMAPPYDVISPEGQERFYARHPYNVIRLILGKDFPDDNESNNKYLRAEKFFTSWTKHGLLVEDQVPAIYVYEQTYKAEGKKLKRLGFISLLRLEDLDRGRVLPHEETFSKHKIDRLALKKACSATFDSIFSIFQDEKSRVEKVLHKYSRRTPVVKAKDDDGVIHCLWRIDSKADIRKLARLMNDLTIFIADGHHRYEASLKYRDEMKDKFQKFTGEELYNHALMYFTPIEGKGLSILPIHRLIKEIPDLDVANFKEALKEYFDIIEVPFSKRTEPNARRKLFKLMAQAKENEHFIGMLIKDCSVYFMLKLKDERSVDRFIKGDKPKEWRRLDVTVLQSILIHHILGLTGEQDSSEGQISYIKNAEDAVKKIMSGEVQMAFFLNPTKVMQIVKIANDKEKMPHKSTYFYPKLLTGLVMNRINMDEKVPLI
jgi:uncharacterized protein (DUF1015 family)